jgi:hypothetical protein
MELTASVSAMNTTGGFNMIDFGSVPLDKLPEATKTLCPLMSNPLMAVPNWRQIDGQKKYGEKKIMKRTSRSKKHVVKLDITKTAE